MQTFKDYMLTESSAPRTIKSGDTLKVKDMLGFTKISIKVEDIWVATALGNKPAVPHIAYEVNYTDGDGKKESSSESGTVDAMIKSYFS